MIVPTSFARLFVPRLHSGRAGADDVGKKPILKPDADPDDNDPPPNRRWFWVPIVCILGSILAIGLVAWISRPAYRHWKLKRFQQQARQFLAKTNLQAAWFSAHAAYNFDANNIETIRLLGEVLGQANQPETLAFRRRLATLEPNATNALLWAQAGLAFDRPPFLDTAKALESVPEQARRTADFHFISAGLELKRGNVAKAEEHFAQVIEMAPTNQQARINLAVLQLRSADARKRDDAQKTLESLRSAPETRATVLRSLVGFCSDSKQDEKALEYSRELVSGEALFEDELTHLNLLKRAGGGLSTEFKARLEALQRGSRQKPEQAAQLAGWMGSNGLADPALAWVRSLSKETQEALPVQIAVADLYSEKKDWGAMEAYLRDRTWPDREFARNALLAYALRNGGDVESSKGRWNRAVRATDDQPQLLGALARMAVSWNWNAEAEGVLWTMVTKHPDEKWATQTLLESYGRAGNTAGLKKVFAAQVEADPNDFDARNNLAVASFLLREDLEKAHQLARGVYDHDPKNAGFIGTYAYSQHLQGRSKEALALFEQLKPENRTDAATAIYYGVVLAAVGERERAIAPLEFAAKSSLLPEERRLAAETLVKVRATRTNGK